MRYPNFINKNSTIGLIAPSMGSNKNPYRIRLQEGIKYFQDKGFNIKKGHHLFVNKKASSDSAINRAKDFYSFYRNKHVDFVWSIGGGEIMMDILPYIDFQKISKLPAKYFSGYSDNTNLTFLLTTICDIATIYGLHIGDFASKPLHQENFDYEDLLCGKKLKFTNYDYYQKESLKDANPLSPLNLTEKVTYKSINMENTNTFSGRIIGGCLDILTLLCGTKYDKVEAFLEKYKNDGFIWYFDSCDYHSIGFYRAILQLKYANYFKYVKGFLIGRVGNTFELLDFTFLEAIEKVLKPLNVPIIYDVDIGHVSPSFPVINGAIATINYENNKFEIEYKLV